MKDISKIRVIISNLQKERFKIELSLFWALPMVEYSLIKAYFPCGKANCRCKKDKKYFHGPYYYLSQHRDGKTKNIYIKERDVGRIKILADRYKEYESRLTEIRRINQEILSLIKTIEEKSYIAKEKIIQYGKKHKD